VGSDDLFARDAAGEALADCGALAGAREREEAGLTNAEDRVLLAHMTGQVLA
jgi:hypothetical protein